MKPIVLLLLLVIFNSCSSNRPAISPEEREVPSGRAVQIVALDSTTRPFNRNLRVFSSENELVGLKYQKIALLSIVAWPEEESRMTTALIWRAKSIGAAGIILRPSTKNNYEFKPFAKSGSKYTFRADAILIMP